MQAQKKAGVGMLSRTERTWRKLTNCFRILSSKQVDSYLRQELRQGKMTQWKKQQSWIMLWCGIYQSRGVKDGWIGWEHPYMIMRE